MNQKKEHPLQWTAPTGLTFEEWVHYETSGALNIGYHQSGLIPPLNEEPLQKAEKRQSATQKASSKRRSRNKN